MSVVADNERYKLTDWTFGGLTVSKTELKAGQSTRGHSHPSPEIYYFLTEAWLELGLLEGGRVSAGEVFEIPPNAFHRVSTLGQSTASFLSFFTVPRDANYNNTK